MAGVLCYFTLGWGTIILDPAALGRRSEGCSGGRSCFTANELARMRRDIESMRGIGPQVNFDAPAVLRKWPSLRNERVTEGTGSYLLIDGTIDECIREFMAKPAKTRHLYEIHAGPQPPLVSAVLSGEQIVELARLRDFL